MENQLGKGAMDFTEVVCLQRHVYVLLFFYNLNVCAFSQVDVELYTVFASNYTTNREL